MVRIFDHFELVFTSVKVSPLVRKSDRRSLVSITVEIKLFNMPKIMREWRKKGTDKKKKIDGESTNLRRRVVIFLIFFCLEE